ncbi:hypothetical protein FALCPG4_003887 [Fusarium falciforme]
MPNLDGWFFHFVEWLYSLPEPPKRERKKPMEVICIGMPRSGTESLQHALIKLGYDHTYHDWGINFESPNYSQQWVRLCRKKWFPPMGGDVDLTAADFDAVMGPKERLLEWSVEDGWEPLCEFLGKPVPDEPFPHENAAVGWAGQEMKLDKRYIMGAVRNLAVLGAVGTGIWAVVYY